MQCKYTEVYGMKGAPCGNGALKGRTLCHVHDPQFREQTKQRRAEKNAARKSAIAAAKIGKLVYIPPEPQNMEYAMVTLALRAEKVYAALDWQWTNVGVPTYFKIRNKLKTMLKTLREQPSDVDAVESGGLRVARGSEPGTYVFEMVISEHCDARPR